MFFWRNREIIKYSDFYSPIKINSETQKVIDLAVSLLTPEQLKTFLVKSKYEEVNNETIGFKERMELYYGYMWPVFSLKRTERIIREEIEDYKDLFEIGIKFDQNRYFIEKLHILFQKNKGEWQKKLRKFLEILTYLIS